MPLPAPVDTLELKRQQEKIEHVFALFINERLLNRPVFSRKELYLAIALLCETFKFLRLKLNWEADDIRHCVDDALRYMVLPWCVNILTSSFYNRAKWTT